MPRTLTPGRYRGLKTSSLVEADVFGIIAFDQRGSYRRMMPPNASYAQLAQVKQEIIGALSQHASAILTDPTYGLGAAMQMSPKAGLLLALEKSGYSGDSSYRRTELIPGWTPETIRKAGASAVKLMVYYHPGSGDLAEELEAFIRRALWPNAIPGICPSSSSPCLTALIRRRQKKAKPLPLAAPRW